MSSDAGLKFGEKVQAQTERGNEGTLARKIARKMDSSPLWNMVKSTMTSQKLISNLSP